MTVSTTVPLHLRNLTVSSIPAASAGYRVPLFVKLHTEVESHTIQDFLDLIQRLLAKVLCGEHLPLAALHQISNGSDVGILQAVI